MKKLKIKEFRANKNVRIAIILTVIVLVMMILLVFFMSQKNTNTTQIFQGDETKIEKTEEQKKCLTIRTLTAPAISQTYFGTDQPSLLVNALVYEPLLKINGDLTIDNVLAESVKFSANGLEAEVTLKNAEFSDGSILTADVVKSSYFEILENDKEGIYAERCSNLKDIQVEGEQKLKFIFDQITAWNIQAFTIPIYKEVAEGWAIGTGPYKMESYLHQESIGLVRNENSQEKIEAYEQIRIARISTLEFSESISNYEIDVLMLPYHVSLDGIKEAGYHNIYRLPDYKTLEYFFINLNNEVGGKKDLRVAMRDAMDRENLSKEFGEEEMLNDAYLTASVEKTNALKRNVVAAQKVVKKAGNPQISYFGGTDTVSQLRYDMIVESLGEAGFQVVRGTESSYTMCHGQSSNGTVLKDIEDNLLSSAERNAYQKELCRIYQESNREWLSLTEELYGKECYVIPYGTSQYHLLVSSDVDSEMVRNLIIHNY